MTGVSPDLPVYAPVRVRRLDDVCHLGASTEHPSQRIHVVPEGNPQQSAEPHQRTEHLPRHLASNTLGVPASSAAAARRSAPSRDPDARTIVCVVTEQHIDVFRLPALGRLAHAPVVATTTATRCPSPPTRANVPPASRTSSSGWAWRATRVGMGLILRKEVCICTTRATA